MLEQLQKAERLNAVTQRVGFALWQLQELEGCSATCFVLLAQARRGMGRAAGAALVKTAQSKTFGATIKQLEKANLLSPNIAAEFARLLKERNWLAHRSRADSRGAIHGDGSVHELLERLDAIAEDATALLKEIVVLSEGLAVDRSVPKEYIDLESRRILKQWEAGEDA
jgi:hypothetical protein